MGWVNINVERCITCLNTHLWEVVNAFMKNISNRVFSRWYTIANTRILTLDLEVTQNIAQYPLHHDTHANSKFKVATTNNFGRDVFIIKYSI